MMEKTLLDLKTNEKGVVTDIRGGHGFRDRLKSRNIREGKEIRIVTKQPRGPVVVESNSCKFTLGRGMARKIHVRNKE